MIWHKTKFRNVAQVVYGKGLPERARKSKGEIPVFGSSGIVGNHTQCLVDFPTIVLARKGSIGNVFKTKKPSWPIDTVYYLKNIKLNFDYLYYYLMSQKFKDTSTAVPSLRREDLEDIEVTYPENENIQINIVEAIETQFTRLDATVKSLNTIKQKLVIYRNSVLKVAFIGCLSKEYRDLNANKVIKKKLLLNIIDVFNRKKIGKDKPGKLPPSRLDELQDLPEKWFWIEAHKVCSERAGKNWTET